jgi:hypothetical protein
MKMDFVIIDKLSPKDDYMYNKKTITLIGDEEGLIALRDIIDMKLKLKNNISTTLAISKDYANGVYLHVELKAE